MILRKKWKKMLVISEIKTEFQGAQGKNRLKCSFTKGIEEMLGNNQQHENKMKQKGSERKQLK